MKAILKCFVPESLRPGARRLWNKVKHGGLSRRCPVCGSRLRRFAPHGTPVEDEAVCPVCGSKAPHRLACLYFARNPKLFRRGGILLHVAPERELGRRLREWAEKRGMTYRSGSIMGTGDQHLDVRNLPFADGSIDLVYCCHVLNCMLEDTLAMKEFFRVLHPEGAAVLQVPAFHQGATTLETHSRAERLQAFHDDGIFRCYTDADYVARLHDAGFAVSRYRAETFTETEIRRFSLKQEVFHICTKPSARAVDRGAAS